LPDVAAHAGLTSEEVVTVHSDTVYHVFMLGFVTGFAYLGSVDLRIAMPRRETPRVRVPAGSVGIAGTETAIYPFETPGGWRIIGRTACKPFDPSRPDPFLLRPGDSVQFHPIDPSDFEAPSAVRPAPEASRNEDAQDACVHVVKAGWLTTVQDGGRWGWQSLGVPVAGPMDPYSHRVANALVGNRADAATLEVTLIGPELEFADDRVVAVTGAEFALTVDRRAALNHAAFPVAAGSRLRFGERRNGSRGYVAISGGVAVTPTFGSRATHVASHTGGFEGRPLRTGDQLPLGYHAAGEIRDVLLNAPRSSVDALPLEPRPGAEPARIRVLAGPQLDRFAAKALDALQSAPYTVHPDSDRIGFRLVGPLLRHARSAEIIPEATPLGTIQVPASGNPVLLMADRQTTGGYPKIATVITADLRVAGQLAPGDNVRFEVCSLKDAIRALIAQERSLMALTGSKDL
jgi:biotin-dependent carboxylase-like uncharacterized protein